MNARKFILQETLYIAIGEVICSAVMILIYVLLGAFDLSVLWGALVGTALGAANFFLMGVGAAAAADKAAAQNVSGGQRTIRLSYTLRLLLLFIILFACAKSGLCNALAMVLPIALVRPVLTVIEFLRKPEDKTQ